MPFPWTPENERLMLLHLITDLVPTKPTFQQAAEKLGGGLTESAVSQKFAKLKKSIQAESGVALTGPSTSTNKGSKAAATTARKRKSKDDTNGDGNPSTNGKAKRSKKAPAQLSSLTAEADDGDDDDDADAAAVKLEGEDGSEVGFYEDDADDEKPEEA